MTAAAWTPGTSIPRGRGPDPTEGDRIAGCGPLWRKYLSESRGYFLQRARSGPIPPRTVAVPPAVATGGPATIPASRTFPVAEAGPAAPRSLREAQADCEALQ